MMRESPIFFPYYISIFLGGVQRGFFAELQKKIFILLFFHDNSSFFFFTLDEIEFGISALGM